MEAEIIGTITQLGVAGVFVFLYWKERNRCADLHNEHIRDLRYIARVRHDRLSDQWDGDEDLVAQVEKPPT